MGARRTVALAALVAAVATGCTSGGSGTAAKSSRPSSTSPAAPTPATSSPTPSPSPTVNPAALLPSSCDALVTSFAASRALGKEVQPPQYLREKPLPSGRLGRVTCTYAAKGVKGTPPPVLSMTVNLYRSAAMVKERVNLTLAHDRANGNTITAATAGGKPATLDAGPAATAVLVSHGPLVLIAHVDHGLAAGTPAVKALLQITAIALDAGALDLPTPSASPSA